MPMSVDKKKIMAKSNKSQIRKNIKKINQRQGVKTINNNYMTILRKNLNIQG